MTGRKGFTENYQEIFRNDPNSSQYTSINPNRSGTYGISYFMFKTAFEKVGDDNISTLFTYFENYRAQVKERLDAINPGGKYALNSQEVVIPAFIAAYTGESPTSVEMSAFPRLPIPNWSLNYRGLSKLPGISDIFNAISISHSYSSRYDISNFINSPLYTIGLTLDNSLRDAGLASEFNENGELVPVYLAQQLVLSETMAPFIGIAMRTKDNWDVNFDYSRERNIALNLSNIQVTEQSSKSITLQIGFAKTGVEIPFRINGRKEKLPNELTFNMGMTISDSRTVQRRIGEESIVTDGIRIFRLSPTLNYTISDALQVGLYFDRNVNEPRVSSSFLNTRTSFGGRIKFSLSQ